MKILILRFSSIGDLVLTTPIVRCLKQQIPKCELHFLTKESNAELVQYNPHIDKVILFKNNLLETVDLLKKEKYDLIIDLHKNLRTALIKILVGVKSKSFQKLNIEKWMFVNFKTNRLPSLHIVDRYFEAVSDLKIKNDGMGLDFFIPKESSVNLEELGFEKEKFIAFVIGGKFATKRLPLEKIISICSKIENPMMLLGGSEDMELGKQVVEALKSIHSNKKITSLCGKFNILQSAFLVSQAEKVISHDTGLMHVAAAFNKPICSVWGNTIPEFGMSPYYGNARVQPDHFSSEVKGLSCRPCSKIGFDKCPKVHFKCMNDQVESEIVSFVHK